MYINFLINFIKKIYKKSLIFFSLLQNLLKYVFSKLAIEIAKKNS